MPDKWLKMYDLAVNGKIPVEFYGRMGGVVPDPEEILKVLEEKLVGVAV